MRNPNFEVFVGMLIVMVIMLLPVLLFAPPPTGAAVKGIHPGQIGGAAPVSSVDRYDRNEE
ncbi:MAG TPA: hypothetical protein VF342_00060 [Alphaproteobacteria bacterium]